MLLRTILRVVVLLLAMLPFYSYVSAEVTKKPVVNKARTCIMCHTKESEKMLGRHAQSINPNNNAIVNCLDCHQSVDKSEVSHPKSASNITRYEPLLPSFLTSQEQLGSHSLPTGLKQDAVAQVGLCMGCHNQESLRTAFWPHDVHANKLSCSDCHSVHLAEDPIKNKVNVEDNKVQLCLDCHNQIKVNSEVKP